VKIGTCTACGRSIHRMGYSSWYHDDWTVTHVAQPVTTYSVTTNASTR
jgi:hypothetical protein